MAIRFSKFQGKEHYHRQHQNYQHKDLYRAPQDALHVAT